MCGCGLSRRTLKDIVYYPTPEEIYAKLKTSPGWTYSHDVEYYEVRDKALVAVIYLLGLRVSEAVRLEKSQFLIPEKAGLNDRIIVRGIILSKSRKQGQPRKDKSRPEGWLPLTGERVPLTRLVLDYLVVSREERLFKFGRKRAWQIVTALVQDTCHWLRAYCENYLYEKWNFDLLAVADYVKVSPRTLQHYIRRRFESYPPA